MSEERFTYDKPLVAFSKGGINDNVTGETYEFTMDTVLDLLNEQQEQIKKDEKSIKTMLQNMEKLEQKLHFCINYLLSDQCKLTDKQLQEIRSELEK